MNNLGYGFFRDYIIIKKFRVHVKFIISYFIIRKKHTDKWYCLQNYTLFAKQDYHHLWYFYCTNGKLDNKNFFKKKYYLISWLTIIFVSFLFSIFFFVSTILFFTLINSSYYNYLLSFTLPKKLSFILINYLKGNFTANITLYIWRHISVL